MASHTLRHPGAPAPREVHLLAGTRPEAVKIAPVVLSMRRHGRLRPVIVASGQHPAMVHQALDAFGLKPDEVLPVNRASGTQPELLAQVLPKLDALWRCRPPAAVLVHGDTTTTFAGALVAFWNRLPIVHLEAGLRSHNLSAPFPEEANRRLVSIVAELHLAPTPAAAGHLVDEGVPKARTVVTGNTVVDAVHTVAARNHPFADPRLADLENHARAGRNRVVLVTVHRRESWGAPLEQVLRALRILVRTHPDMVIVLPAHPNPDVRAQIHAALNGIDRVVVTEPLGYSDLVRTLAMSVLVLSDSGGLQEEAPSFGVPVLVLRDVTERREAIEAGCAVLVGTDENRILDAAGAVLAEPPGLRATNGGNPFGDGQAARRCEQAIAHLLGLDTEAPEEFGAPIRISAGDLGRGLRPART